MSVRDAGNVVGTSISEQQVMKQSVQKRGTPTTYFLFPNYAVRVFITQVKVESRGLDDYFVVGHSTNSQIGGNRYKVGSPADSWTEIEVFNENKSITLDLRDDIAKWLNNESITEPSYGAVGTGTTSYNYSQSALVSETGTRKVIETKDNSTSKEITYKFHLLDRSDSNLREFGLFSLSSAGVMAFRKVISNLDLSIDTEYRFTVVMEIEDVTPGDSMITNYGMNEIRDKLTGNNASIPDYMGWSDGTGSLAYTDTTLDGSNKQRNVMKSMSDSRPTVPGYKTSYLGILTSAQLSSQTLTKSGLFTDSSGSTLFAQNRFGDISKTSLFKVQEQDSITVR